MVNVITVGFVLLTTATVMSAMVLPLSVTNDDSDDDFKELVYDSIQELIAEGRISPQPEATDSISDVSMPTKRRRQGTCYRRARSGKKKITIPYRCWKEY